jgi:hypothetical protein
MIWYAFANSSTFRASRAKSSGRWGIHHDALRPKSPGIHRVRCSQIALVLAIACILGIACMVLAAHIDETSRSARLASRSPICIIAQMGARRDRIPTAVDDCAM